MSDWDTNMRFMFCGVCVLLAVAGVGLQLFQNGVL